MTAAAARTSSIQLRMSGVDVGHHHHVRLAEETVIVDLYSRGRAGMGFAGGRRTGVEPGRVHETIDFVRTAWSTDEFRYRGEHIRFPASTPDTAPQGPSEPEVHEGYMPQWDWGPATPSFLAITPKPYATTPPVYVEIDDDETLEWAARNAVSPFIRASMPTEQAIASLQRYRKVADIAGQRKWAVEPVIERRISLDSPATDVALGGEPASLVVDIRNLKAQTGFTHLVWRRTAAERGQSDSLLRFASEVQPLLQA
jgi:alkanesulfonate monooxygenase SsuD/methylene tetrahydromethanopterin reductase-like flavin-dependent oxidoreductase (luciferase family)